MHYLVIFLFTLVSLPSFASEARPDLAIKIKAQILCERGESLNSESYQNFCRETDNHLRTLYVLLDPSSDIMLNRFFHGVQKLGSTKDWCLREIDDGRVGPDCFLEVEQTNTNLKTHLSVHFINDNLIGVNLNPLQQGQSYKAKILEKGSGSNVSSMPFLFKNP